MEAPPPIYPQNESQLDACPSGEAELHMGALPQNDQPSPERAPSFEIIKCPPTASKLIVARAAPSDSPREFFVMGHGRQPDSELLRPPQRG